MKTKTLVIAAYAALTLAACSIGKPIPQATTYIVETMPPGTAASARRPETLRMGNVRVAAPFAGSAFVYRMDDVRYVADPYEMFIAEPAEMLGSRMAEWLDRAGPFKSVAQPGSTQPASYVLEATVTELYGDFRGGTPPVAVMSVQFTLVDLTGVRSTTVFDRTISRRVEITKASPDALARGYGKALSEILAELRGSLQAVVN
jgi:uncharacterized lipoprotein YmbA